MGSCLTSPPSVENVNPNSRCFSVCCEGRVVITDSEFDGAYKKSPRKRWTFKRSKMGSGIRKREEERGNRQTFESAILRV